MIRRLARAAVVIAAAPLLLTACTDGGETPVPKAAPATPPVFDRPLDRQILLALRQTQQAGDAGFTQTLTFASKKGPAVQTMSGRADFAADRGEASVA
ncbi:hypothetical protein ABZX98_28820 [Streptomyces sp. NPDC002992]|uniref:hypothetical protein n=1 Tax=Streptomyces sp. NPDC002992 TaxID=3154273 RepID=UPI0033B180E3